MPTGEDWTVSSEDLRRPLVLASLERPPLLQDDSQQKDERSRVLH